MERTTEEATLLATGTLLRGLRQFVEDHGPKVTGAACTVAVRDGELELRWRRGEGATASTDCSCSAGDEEYECWACGGSGRRTVRVDRSLQP